MWPFKKKIVAQYNDPQDVAVAVSHLKTIRKIADSHTGFEKTHRRASEQVSVVVPYDDMLRIWNLADRAIDRL